MLHAAVIKYETVLKFWSLHSEMVPLPEKTTMMRRSTGKRLGALCLGIRTATEQSQQDWRLCCWAKKAGADHNPVIINKTVVDMVNSFKFKASISAATSPGTFTLMWWPRKCFSVFTFLGEWENIGMSTRTLSNSYRSAMESIWMYLSLVWQLLCAGLPELTMTGEQIPIHHRRNTSFHPVVFTVCRIWKIERIIKEACPLAISLSTFWKMQGIETPNIHTEESTTSPPLSAFVNKEFHCILVYITINQSESKTWITTFSKSTISKSMSAKSIETTAKVNFEPILK